MLGSTAFAALLTFFLTTVLAAALQPVARRVGLVDRPSGRKDHAAPTPAIGGVSILLAIAPLALWLLPLTDQAKGMGLAAVIILATGVVDDFFRIRWQYRLCAQVLAALAMIYIGHIRVDHVGQVFGLPNHPLGPLSIPLTILATVGIINAINMMDGVDGLAGSVALVAVGLLAAAAIYAGNDRLANGLGLVFGGLCAFLMFNMRAPWNPRARIFLGNAGSELLGLIIACASIRLTQNGQHPVGVQVAPFLIAPALIDCLTLMIRRARMGVSPFEGDRNHLHHLLLDAGATPSAVVAIVGGLTLVIGAVAALALKAHAPAPLFTLAFVALWGGYFILTRRRERSVEIFSHLLLLAPQVFAPRPIYLAYAAPNEAKEVEVAAPIPLWTVARERSSWQGVDATDAADNATVEDRRQVAG